MSCRDYGPFLGFILAREKGNNAKPTYVGNTLFCVSKNDRKVFVKELSDLSGGRWKPIPIRLLNV